MPNVLASATASLTLCSDEYWEGIRAAPAHFLRLRLQRPHGGNGRIYTSGETQQCLRQTQFGEVVFDAQNQAIMDELDFVPVSLFPVDAPLIT